MDRCQLRPGAGINSTHSRPVCTPACRVVTSIYDLRLKRWDRSPGFLNVAGVSIHALTVSGNPKKFAIAVTRARVDSPSFLVVIPSCCALHASLGRETLPETCSKP